MKTRSTRAAATPFLVLLIIAATALSAPISLELAGGSLIKGDLVSWNGQQAVVKAEFGSLTFKREQLSQATLQRLDLLSGDPQKLVARIAELEATVESLRKDNAVLRQQLQAALAAPTAPAPGPALPVNAIASTRSQSAPASTGLSYTVSSTGKRHNSRCRYYGSGRSAGPNEGIPCKICGG
jgi:hypothetical protein